MKNLSIQRSDEPPKTVQPTAKPTPLPKTVEREKTARKFTFCPECGEKLPDPNAKSCPSCGTRLDG